MPPQAPYCEGAKRPFDPNTLIRDWHKHPSPEKGPFSSSITLIFGLSQEDKYVYNAGPAGVTLLQAQTALLAKGKNGLHAWYRDGEGNEIPPPIVDDVVAYADLFDPSKSIAAALRAFESNAKKGSRRHEIAQHLSSHLILPRAGLIPGKNKRQHMNPYYDFWRWSCKELEWGGPFPNTASTKTSHHVLPVFYHHFGCVVPSYAALYMIAQLAQPKGGPKVPSKPILDIGSGSGYWTFMLRKLALPTHMSPLVVHAIDNQRSLYRTMWVDDTIRATGEDYLDEHDGGKDAILLLVYPQTEEEFVPKTVEHYTGGVIVVAATQNADGFTAFKEETMDAWMKREHPEFEHAAQIPLPSFAGKDEALYVFERRDSSAQEASQS
ncbi:hypothetical protein BU16DRAFT_521449 [Lophium mytilinum]|uniref:Uncharacterized protein n=1 Tax=Lophium mytilinum TaxID=390894 RepID=A0A6A6RDY7_9PEZI|nr:hypothetical protein BU16DRAFT_521449 [Lophium mytilinum]